MTFPDETTLRSILELACRAPSIHNTQPWSWSVRGEVLLLRSDERRHLAYADPSRRDLVLSCGAALHELRVSASAAGWRCEVRRLPDRHDESLLAAITFRPHEPTEADLREAGAVVQRYTDRRQVSSWPVARGRLDHLVSLCRPYGVIATVVADEQRRVVSRALVTAGRRQQDIGGYLDELEVWTTGAVTDGVPSTSLLAPDHTRAVPPSYSRFPAGDVPDTFADVAPPSAEWLVLATASDDRAAWLHAGEALDAVWLSCTISGLALVPYTQPIEVGEVRRALQRQILGGTSSPQVLVRVGWPQHARSPLPATPRRSVDDVLHGVAPDLARP